MLKLSDNLLAATTVQWLGSPTSLKSRFWDQIHTAKTITQGITKKKQNKKQKKNKKKKQTRNKDNFKTSFSTEEDAYDTLQ